MNCELRSSSWIIFVVVISRTDLARLFRLYCVVPNSLVPIARMLREHIIQLGADVLNNLSAASSPPGPAASPSPPLPAASASPAPVPAPAPAPASSSAPPAAAGLSALEKELPYVEDLITLHDRYSDLVTNAFQAHAHFHKALKEARVFSSLLLACWCLHMLCLRFALTGI